RVAEALASACLRPADLVARYGGEEFALLLPGTAREGAEHMAHRVLDSIEALQIPHAASPTANHVTASVGIGCYAKARGGGSERGSDAGSKDTGSKCTADDLVRAADAALYAAKEAGRAQARVLDAAHSDKPELAHELSPLHRASSPR